MNETRQDIEVEARRRAKAARAAMIAAMPRRRSSRQKVLQAKRVEEEKKQHIMSVQEFILAEERRLLENKKKRKFEIVKRRVLEHATSLEFELQHLISLLQRTPRQKVIMQKAQQMQGYSSRADSGQVAGSERLPESSYSDEDGGMNEIRTKLEWFSCAVILSHILAQDTNGWFYRPVADIVPDYNESIAPCIPSDLGTIWCTLMQHDYDQRNHDFVRDVRRVWKNCKLYNGEHAQVTVEAMRLSSIFEASWSWLRGDFPEDLQNVPPKNASESLEKENGNPEMNQPSNSKDTPKLETTDTGSSELSAKIFTGNSAAVDSTAHIANPSSSSLLENEGPSLNPQSTNTVADSAAHDISKNKEEMLVQCDYCRKWHTVPESIDLESLPDQWYCSMNTWNPREARCDLRRSMGIAPNNSTRGSEPSTLLDDKKWLNYAQEIAKFIGIFRKVNLPKSFIQGIEKLYAKVQDDLMSRSTT